MKDNYLAIIVVCYNRPNSLKRILFSLENAEYSHQNINLIISIDYSGSDENYRIAEEFSWNYGDKQIIQHSKNLGLRNHILCCGDLTEKYENIILLEDDLYVSPQFYNFAKEAIDFYKDDEKIAGISLYTHKWNVNVNRPFLIGDDMADVYFHQFAQSWGQIWSRKNWLRFKNWYLDTIKNGREIKNIPNIVKNWPETSWLKYHIMFLAEKNLYFLYPKISLTTNFTEIGQHACLKVNDYQVELQIIKRASYKLIKFEESNLKYDVYFERECVKKYLDLEFDKEDICIDLYGEKSNYENARYWLTSKKKNFKIIKSFGLNFRPHENNILFKNQGEDIFLYDTQIIKENKNIDNSAMSEILYDIKSISRKKLLKVSLRYIIQKMLRRK